MRIAVSLMGRELVAVEVSRSYYEPDTPDQIVVKNSSAVIERAESDDDAEDLSFGF